MKSYNDYKNSRLTPSVFFGNLMAVRQNAHVLHLSSKSYSEHKALAKFYENLVNFTDFLIESYQGQYGLVEIEQFVNKEKNVEIFLKRAAEDFAEAHKLFNEKDTHIHNIIDEIVALTYQTQYKVKFLK
jgi:tryptophan synthase beta subunit